MPVSQGRDLSAVTDTLWKTFYEKRFGNTDGVIEKMRKHNVPFKWKHAYEISARSRKYITPPRFFYAGIYIFNAVRLLLIRLREQGKFFGGMMVASLVDLCIKKWKDNVWSLADVGEIDDYLLDKMLPLCSVDQLKYVEGCTKVSHGRDLSPVTDKLWKTFYEASFYNSDEVIEKMRKHNVPFKWKKAYEYKEEEIIAQEQIRRLVVFESEYFGATYYQSRSRARAREETDFLNSHGEDYYHYYNNNNNNDYDDVEEEEEEEDDETDVEEEFLERVGGGQVSVEEAEQVEEEEEGEDDDDDDDGYDDDDDDYHYHCFNNGSADEEGEEEFLERVGREVSVEELVEEEIQIEKAEEMEVEEQIRIEEGEEVEEQTQILEEEEHRDMSEVGQGEDGYDDDSYGNDYYDGGYDSDYGCDDGYGDDFGCDYGSDDGYY
ncbi:hypothetical protein K1719_014456 [Acacia pycnantha]|nr:hypothetical protein K1719_014456 [Acacia pycnantha]